jgi:hypothetical protein
VSLNLDQLGWASDAWINLRPDDVSKDLERFHIEITTRQLIFFPQKTDQLSLCLVDRVSCNCEDPIPFYTFPFSSRPKSKTLQMCVKVQRPQDKPFKPPRISA